MIASLPLRCTACGRRFGYQGGTISFTNRVYCSPQCLRDPAPPSPHERRNDWFRVFFAQGFSPVSIGKLWGIHYAQIYRILRPYSL